MAAMPQPEREGRRRLSPDERETLILDATERVLAQKGLVGASMSAIARDAGMSKRTLYEVFANREALFRALVRRTRALFFRPLTAEERLLPLAARLKRLLEPDGREAAWRAPVTILRAVLMEAASQPELARLILHEGIDTCRSSVREELEQAHSQGEFPLADADMAARMLCDMAYGSPLEQLLDPGREPPSPAMRRQRLELAVRIFLTGAEENVGRDEAQPSGRR